MINTESKCSTAFSFDLSKYHFKKIRTGCRTLCHVRVMKNLTVNFLFDIDQLSLSFTEINHSKDKK